MDRVHSVDDKPLDNVRHVAIAIGNVDADQRHIGMLHREPESAAVMMLHLAWHHLLKNEPLDASFLWVDPIVHPRRLRQVSAICRKVWKASAGGGIPYAFSQPSECFDAETGDYLLGPTRLWLTCATFILAVFRTAGLKLVQYDSWPVGREGDADWQQKMVAMLEKHGASNEHINAVRAEIGAARYRPEEVAGAATVAPIPASFPAAEKRGGQIRNRLEGN